ARARTEEDAGARARRVVSQYLCLHGPRRPAFVGDMGNGGGRLRRCGAVRPQGLFVVHPWASPGHCRHRRGGRHSRASAADAFPARAVPGQARRERRWRSGGSAPARGGATDQGGPQALREGALERPRVRKAPCQGEAQREGVSGAATRTASRSRGRPNRAYQAQAGAVSRRLARGWPVIQTGFVTLTLAVVPAPMQLVGWKEIVPYSAKHGGPTSRQHLSDLAHADPMCPILGDEKGCVVTTTDWEFLRWLDLRKKPLGLKRLSERAKDRKRGKAKRR